MKQAYLTFRTTATPPTRKHTQRGVSLPMVLIFLLLAIIAVLGAFRSSFLNEKIVSSESDQSRAFAAAEAMLRDAEMDIRGRRPPYDVPQANGEFGLPCRPKTTTLGELESATGYEGSCRLRGSTTPWFPRDNEEFDQVMDILASQTDRCMSGICMPLSLEALNDTSTGNTLIERKMVYSASPLSTNPGVTYGKYTRQDLSTTGLDGTQSNPLLATSLLTPPRAWYVVEAFRYGEFVSSGQHPATALRPDAVRNFIYRITAVAVGRQETTRVVLKSIFVPFPANQNK